jgi:DNA-binding SARP family transcriptional activator
MLIATADAVDALQFERLVRQAIDAKGEPEECRRLCRDALGLWRGVPFGDLGDEFPFRLEAIRLGEIRHATMELSFEAEIALGHHDLVVGAIEAAVEEYPFRERLWYLLIEALEHQERRREALRACHDFRKTLADAGLGPGRHLVELEERLLAG